MVPGITYIFVKNYRATTTTNIQIGTSRSEAQRTVFEIYIINARTDRYNRICFIDAHEKQQPLYVDYSISGSGNA